MCGVIFLLWWWVGGYRVIADSVSISILLLKLLMWKMLDLDFPWLVGGDTVKQRERGLELWGTQQSITPSGQIAAEPVQRALWPGHSPEDQKEGSPWGPARGWRNMPSWGWGARKIEREGRKKWGEVGRKLRVKSQDDLSHTLTPPSTLSFVNFFQRKHDD